MTPKENAKKLVNRYLDYIPFADNSIQRAKECALIAVDEILEECLQLKVAYWEEVKEQIETL